MKRPWHTWLAYLACVAVLLAAMGWFSKTVLRLERANAEVQRQAAVEEAVRLALWRMDAAIAPLIVEESARPYFEYAAFNRARDVENAALAQQAVQGLVPSPLLSQVSSNVNVWFNGALVNGQLRPNLTSPQVPEQRWQQFAFDNYDVESQFRANDLNFVQFTDRVSVADLAHAMGIETTSAPSMDATVQQVAGVSQQVEDAQQWLSQRELVNAPVQMGRQTVNQSDYQQQAYARNTQEYEARKGQTSKKQSRLAQSKQALYSQYRTGRQQDEQVAAQPNPAPFPAPAEAEEIAEDVMRPFWVHDALVLARRVTVDGAAYIQGAWLNWDTVREELLAEIRDLFPEARLVPAPGETARQRGRLMASLPVMLIPGRPASPPAVLGPPLRVPLVVAWVCVLLTAIAVGLLLIGAVTLSERRAAFVSAVTHELRTPLTTFQMYAEMLEQGMVTEPDQQRAYLATLRAEGSRLTHLVENVLSYSRIERGKTGGHPEAVTLGELVDKARDRLAQRAEQAAMALVVDTAESAEVFVDRSMVDQVLFNLVDNAAKYAVSAEDKRIHVETACVGKRGVIRVRDHGPGIDPTESRRLFRPFHKSAKNAAESAPGVGLGLALSLRLARQMNGNLAIRHTPESGACFELALPLA